MKLPPTAFVVDDDKGMLATIGDLLRSANIPVQLFSSARRFLRQYDPVHPGCIVCDLAMPGFDGLALQRALKAMGGRSPIIFLSGRGTVPRSVAAMKAGAVDFLTKPHDLAILARTVRQALAHDAAARLLRKRLGDLTERELEVLRRVTGGQLNKEIAADLKVTERTVKFHRGNLMRKLDVSTTAQLVQLAIAAGVEAWPNSR